MAKVDGKCLLKLSNSDSLRKFVHESVDDLVGRKHNDVGPCGGDLEWTKAESQRARSLIQNIYKQLVVEDETFPSISDLSEENVRIVKECYEVRKEEIYQALARERFLQMGQPLVENIDWKLKWVIGCSELASLSEPLLQVDLHCSKKDKERSTVNFEMNMEYVDLLIKELENAKINLSLN